MRSFKRILKAALVVVPMAFASVSADAETISTSGGSFNFSWSYTGTCTDADKCVLGETQLIEGNGSITAAMSGGNLVLTVTLNNTTGTNDPLPAGYNMALYSFGFGIDPNATSVSLSDAADGGMSTAVLSNGGNSEIPSLDADLIDVCAFGDNNCSGGNVNTGIGAGGSDTFDLILAGTWGSSVTIAPIGFKFQGTIGSFEFYSSSSSSSSSSSGGGSGETSSSSSGAVPEPASSTLVGLGLGLLGFGFMRRRKNAA